MKKALFTLTLMASFGSSASGLHLSPELKFGPYVGSGNLGAGLQVGITDVLGLDALYVSYSHTSAKVLTDKDRLKTYRIGAQYHLTQAPMIGFQVEIGGVKYEGSRHYIFSPKEYRDGSGVSAAGAWVLQVNDSLGFRAGIDINFVDKKDTYLNSDFSTTFNTGVTLRF
ncbi:hypothetical protein [Vibrio renipiscarius]|uniref:Outer membrane protein beta-barrel domain-containing protein n=1 Tax=Vibrio renipiscarius TaxID=1461322 RepID=A0A0C2NUG9_9VIBR|nr:hypothetical protein [Vibrio renipiscarius]KII79835.1 hypothetical protein OJ16_07445 [Vibrio renipiscarius]KII80190.1 hypothetical protein PL18_06290 [Vibrio renipiscarius]